jgi:hypothetical protein
MTATADRNLGMSAGQYLTSDQKLYRRGPTETLQTSVQSENMMTEEKKMKEKKEKKKKENTLYKEKEEFHLTGQCPATTIHEYQKYFHHSSAMVFSHENYSLLKMPSRGSIVL